MKTVKFPKGIIYDELCHYTHADDIDSISERPLIAQQLVYKLSPGKTVELSDEEHGQLIKELDNMIDIKADHVYPGEKWNPLTQYQLVKYFNKICAL